MLIDMDSPEKEISQENKVKLSMNIQELLKLNEKDLEEINISENKD